MKKLSIIFGLILTLTFTLMSNSAFPVSLRFDIHDVGEVGDEDWDTDWALNAEETVEIDVWLDEYTGDPVTSVCYTFPYDPTVFEMIDAWPNDTDIGGPWFPSFSFANDLGGWYCVRSVNFFIGVLVEGSVKLHTIVLKKYKADLFSEIRAEEGTLFSEDSSDRQSLDDACAIIHSFSAELITISPQSETVFPGDTIQFSASEGSSFCSEPCYNWEITSSIGSTIDDKGLYRAGDTEGTDIITVIDNCNDISNIATIEVVPCKVTAIPIAKSVFPEETIQFSASVCGECNNPCYSWGVTSGEGTIDANGLYTAGSAFGTEMVTVTDTCNNNISDTATVKIAPCKVTIIPLSESVFTGETLQFTATVDAYMGATCNGPCYTWEVMETCNTGSTIDASGLYRAGENLGTEMVIVTDTCNSNISDTGLVDVISAPTSTTTTVPTNTTTTPATSTTTTTVPCTSDDDCDDGSFCNGAEICSKGICWGGSEPCPDDETFCNGEESCDEEDDVCTHSGDPCTPDFTCDEDSDLCLGCSTDADCNDGVFCNGVETCQDEVCQPGSDPCPDDGLFCNGEESCDEENDECFSSGNPCTPGEECDEGDNVCVPQSPLPLLFDLIPDSAVRSHLIPLPLFMLIVSTDPATKFDSTATVSFSGDAITPPWTVVLSENLIFTFSLINPASLEATGSIAVEVTVTTDEGKGTATLNLNMLPLILDEEREKLKGDAL